jgi:hypothetical protein
MRIEEIPVIGDVLDAAVFYVASLARILRRPFGFVDSLDFAAAGTVSDASRFLGIGIAVGYTLFTAALTAHDFQLSEFSFGLVVLLRLAVVVMLYHLLLVFTGQHPSLKRSYILGCFINGVWFPLWTALTLPAYLAVGPKVYLDPSQSLDRQQELMLQHLSVGIPYLAMLLLFSIFFAVTAWWWSRATGARYWLGIILLAVAIALSGLANRFVLPHITQYLL